MLLGASPFERRGVRAKSEYHSTSVTATNSTESTEAISSWTPHARPRAITANTKTASLLSSSVVRNRTAATTPARLNARATLFRTSVATIATTIGSSTRLCTTDCEYPFFCRVNM